MQDAAINKFTTAIYKDFDEIDNTIGKCGVELQRMATLICLIAGGEKEERRSRAGWIGKDAETYVACHKNPSRWQRALHI